MRRVRSAYIAIVENRNNDLRRDAERVASIAGWKML
jgi:hypothetical protein